MRKLAPSKRNYLVDRMLVDLVLKAEADNTTEVNLTVNDIQHLCEVLRGGEEHIRHATLQQTA